jgi:hypothetical protein
MVVGVAVKVAILGACTLLLPELQAVKRKIARKSRFI